MAWPALIPLTEAAAFTLGCAVLNTGRFDPERVGVVLSVVIAALLFALLVVATANGAAEATVPQPDELYSVLE